MVRYEFTKRGEEEPTILGELYEYFSKRVDSRHTELNIEPCPDFVKDLIFDSIIIDLGINATTEGPFKVEVIDEFFTTCSKKVVYTNASNNIGQDQEQEQEQEQEQKQEQEQTDEENSVMKYRSIIEDLLYKEYSFRSWC